MAIRFRHIGIVVSDLEKALGIYQNCFGLELVAKYPIIKGKYASKLVGIDNVEMQVAILCSKDNNRFELIEYISPKGIKRILVLSNDIGASHFALTVEDLQRIYDEHHNFDIHFISEPLLSPDGSVKVAYALIMQECLVELVEVLDSKGTYSGGIFEGSRMIDDNQPD
jgi:catechol 2,3-dioxygenase-like lactoylglutathione lyase family enzyme